jgi:hypothetical protein
LLFDFINLPNEDSANSGSDCNLNYVSIASQLKPYDNVKLCGFRRRVKFITTYNNVLIKMDINALKDSSSGFSLTFKVIMSPSDCERTPN